MGPFPSSNGYTHILVVVDYVTKWVEAIPTSSVDHNTSIKMLKEVIFPRFGVPRYLMTDGGSHFIHGASIKCLPSMMLTIELHHPIILGLFTTKKDTSVTFWAERKKNLSYL